MPSFFRRRALCLVLAWAVLLRVGMALYLGDSVEALPGTHDQISYDALAQNVAAGQGFVFDKGWYPFTPAHTPTAHWSFLYALYLAAVYTVVGHHPLVARLIQAVVVGLLMPLLVFRLGNRTFGRAVGLAGALALSVYVYLVYYSATLMTEPFYITAVLWSLDGLQRIARRARERQDTSLREWMELGSAWAIAALLRQQMLLLVPVFLAWLLWATWGRIGLARFGRSAVLSLTVVVAFILPWTIRNYVVYGGFLPLNSNIGYALYAANHPDQGSRFEPFITPPIPSEWRGLDEAELNNRLMVAGIGFVLEDPGRYALQTVDRLRNYYRFWPEPSSSTIANVSRVLSFGLYLPFMLYGLLLSKRNRCCAHQVILIYLYIAVYSAIHLLSWAMHRYRLPVDAVVMVFVGLALLDIFQRMSRWYAVRFRAGEMSSP